MSLQKGGLISERIENFIHQNPALGWGAGGITPEKQEWKDEGARNTE